MKRIFILAVTAVIAGASLTVFAGRDQSQLTMQERQYKTLADKSTAAATAPQVESTKQMQAMMDHCMQMMDSSAGAQKK